MNLTHSNTESLVLTLFDIGAVRLGQFTLRSGKLSPIYLDLRVLVSYPEALRQAAAVYRTILELLSFNCLAGIPMAGLPIGTAIALDMNRPLIFPRPQAKGYGTGKMIEGKWDRGDTAVMIDDLITYGGSLLGAIDTLKEAGLKVTDAIVLIDREQGGRRNLKTQGINLHAGMTLNQILAILEIKNRITDKQRQEVVQALGI